MNTSWKLQDAKAKFSQVVENALKMGPQYVTRRGKDAVVILSVKEYQKITTQKTDLERLSFKLPQNG